jgi:hypothetical protein
LIPAVSAHGGTLSRRRVYMTKGRYKKVEI